MRTVSSEEIETMRLLRRQGWSYRDIAHRLGLSPSTAHKYASGVIPETHPHGQNIPVTPRLNLSQRQKVVLAALASDEGKDLGQMFDTLIELYSSVRKHGHRISDIREYLDLRETMARFNISLGEVKEYTQLRAELAKKGLAIRNIEELSRLMQDFARLGVDVERAKKLARLDSQLMNLDLTPEDAVERLRVEERLNNLGFALEDALLIAKEIGRLGSQGLSRPKAIRKMCDLLTQCNSLEAAVNEWRRAFATVQTELTSLTEERDALITERDRLKLQCEEEKRQHAEEKRKLEAALNEHRIIVVETVANKDAIMTARAWLNALTEPHMLTLEEIEILGKELEKAEAIRKGQAPYLASFKEAIDDRIQSLMVQISLRIVKDRLVERREYEAKVRELQNVHEQKRELTRKLQDEESEKELLGDMLKEATLRLKSTEEELGNVRSDRTVLEAEVEEKTKRIAMLTEEKVRLEAWPRLNIRPEDLTIEQLSRLIPILTQVRDNKVAMKEIMEGVWSTIKAILGIPPEPEAADHT